MLPIICFCIFGMVLWNEECKVLTSVTMVLLSESNKLVNSIWVHCLCFKWISVSTEGQHCSSQQAVASGLTDYSIGTETIISDKLLSCVDCRMLHRCLIYKLVLGIFIYFLLFNIFFSYCKHIMFHFTEWIKAFYLLSIYVYIYAHSWYLPKWYIQYNHKCFLKCHGTEGETKTLFVSWWW